MSERETRECENCGAEARSEISERRCCRWCGSPPTPEKRETMTTETDAKRDEVVRLYRQGAFATLRDTALRSISEESRLAAEVARLRAALLSVKQCKACSMCNAQATRALSPRASTEGGEGP